MNNESIDFKAVFGGGTGFYPLETAETSCAPIPCPGAPACPPVQEMTVVTEPLEPVCTCTPGEAAYREGAEAMRREVLRALDVMGEEGGCTCLWHVEAAVRGVEW